MTTIYNTRDNKKFNDYAAAKDHEARLDAEQAAFDKAFGRPEQRTAAQVQAAVAALRGAPPKHVVQIAPATPTYQGGLTQAQVDRNVDNAMRFEQRGNRGTNANIVSFL